MRPLSIFNVHWRSAFLAAALTLSFSTGSRAEDKTAADPRIRVGGASGEDDAAAAKYFTDTELLDQNGRPHRFYRDLIRGRRVLINFTFSSCQGACLTMNANLARVRSLLEKRGDKDVTILTITVDPEKDTPQALKSFARKFKAGPGWYFLTGTPANVRTVLKRLGGFASKPDEHTTTLLIGDARTGIWTKSVATDPPDALVYLINHLNDDLDIIGKR